MATLSAIYLTRNEEGFIKKSLDSVAPYVDEVIVVDSGSVDKTIHYCRQYKNVTVVNHLWVHDFSKSRNFGLKKCKSDWVLAIDADEMVDKRSMGAIKTAIEKARPEIMGFSIHIIDHHENWDSPPAPDGPKSFFPSPQIRLFRRMPQVSYEGRVGESVLQSINRANGSVDMLDARLHHFLWRGRGAEHGKMKIQYYNSMGGNHPVPDAGRQPCMDQQPVAEGPKPEVAIVMLGHNCLAQTKMAIESIQRTTSTPYHLFFVNNGSTDGTQAYVHGLPGVKVIDQPKNDGVAKGKNAGLRVALLDPNIKLVCMVDNDIVATPGWDKALVSAMAWSPTTGIAGPMTSFADGPQLLLDKGATCDATASAVSRREPEAIRAEYIHGFCMMLDVNALRKVGLFEESFGAYGHEDHDLCLRMRQAGYDVIVAQRAYVEHLGKATIKGTKPRTGNWYSIFRTSNARFMAKWKTKPVPNIPAVPMATRNISPQASASSGPRVSIVILTCNRLDITRECLESLQRFTYNYELVIVDNGSSDGTLEYVRSRFPWATLIKNDRNMGVPIARNQGIRASSCDLVVMMDNDVFVKQGWLDELMKPLEEGSDIAGIEAWQLDKNWCACHKCVNPTERFDYLGGACCLFRRRVFEEAGLLDEGFSPSYFEDVDISLRAKFAGMKLAWVPTHKIKHKEHQTLIYGQKDFNYQGAMAQSYTRFAAKMRKEIQVTHEKLPPHRPRLRVLYLGMEWDYGDRNRGLSFEHDNFYPSLKQWDKMSAFEHFDFVELGKTHGQQRMSDMLLERVQQFRPDILFGVWFNEASDPKREVIKRISATTPCKTIGWFCDSHFRYSNFDRPWADFLDFCTTTSASAYEWYQRDGLGAKAIKTQWACSPKYSRHAGTTMDVDVSFVGQPHGDRRQVVSAIQRAGIQVQTYGYGWGRRLTFDEMIVMFNRSKISLNLNNACDAKHKQIKGRNFEIPGCGGFLLTGNAENLSDYYVPDKEIAIFESTQQMIDKIKHFLCHEEERRAIAEQGYLRTMHEHTYAQRFNHIFSRIGLL